MKTTLVFARECPHTFVSQLGVWYRVDPPGPCPFWKPHAVHPCHHLDGSICWLLRDTRNDLDEMLDDIAATNGGSNAR